MGLSYKVELPVGSSKLSKEDMYSVKGGAYADIVECIALYSALGIGSKSSISQISVAISNNISSVVEWVLAINRVSFTKRNLSNTGNLISDNIDKIANEIYKSITTREGINASFVYDAEYAPGTIGATGLVFKAN